MSKEHNKISATERDKIAQLVSQKVGVREIARRLGRGPSSISDELTRNSHKEAGYVAIHTQQLTDERRTAAGRRRETGNRLHVWICYDAKSEKMLYKTIGYGPINYCFVQDYNHLTPRSNFRKRGL